MEGEKWSAHLGEGEKERYELVGSSCREEEKVIGLPWERREGKVQ
jgi:hypothetical protein